MDAETVTLVGEGGIEWEFALPLAEVYADQVKTLKLKPKSEDDRDAVAHLLDNEHEQEADGAPPEELTLSQRIDAVASHADANALADELGVEGFEAKAPKLDEKKAQLVTAAAAAAQQ